ncbi:hypothetical protein [Bradyrhizobium sp. NAS80.1]|uniref:hypothetical protein n=1 Tax=Bradyrhizobium sp. NAS80.1 TaxID=1680159 RepID=UPI002679EE0D
MPETNDPKPDEPKPDEPRADGDLTRAYERIKSAEEDLARLDRLVSGMESGSDGPSTSQSKASAGPDDDPPEKPSSPQSEVHQESPKENRPIVRAFVGLLLAIGVLGAAFASQYRDEARAIMARWAPPVSSPPPQTFEMRSPAAPPPVKLAAADDQVPVPAPPVQKNAESNPPTAATPPDQKPAELAQSLKAITDQLASINEKLEQLKSRHEQTQHEQADAIRRLKTAQEKDASDSARLAAQVQALQTQLTASSAAAKPATRSVVKESDSVARPHVQAAAPPRRPRPPRGPWMPPPYMVDPYGDMDW